MSNELILELELLLKNIEHGSPASLFIREVRALKAAITFISSHDSVRDRALEEAALSAERYLGYRLHGSLAENLASDAAYHKTRKDIAATIRALKSAPFTHKDGTTSPEPQMYERHKGSIAAYHTDDTRGTVDRRKSAEGSITDFDCPRLRRFGPTRYGRRPGDRARWTGEAAPVVECLSCGDTKKMPYEPLNPSSKTYPCPYCMPQQSSATQPAQEAPQPEKPGLVEDFERIFCGQWQTLDRFPVDAPVQFGAVKWIVRRLAELDRRQGAK